MKKFEEILLSKAKEDYGSAITLYKLFHGRNSHYTVHDIVVASAIEFAKQACEEQRQLCSNNINCETSSQQIEVIEQIQSSPLPNLK